MRRTVLAPIGGSIVPPAARTRSTQRWNTATLTTLKNISPRTAEISNASDSSHTPRSNSGSERRDRHSAQAAGRPHASASTSSYGICHTRRNSATWSRNTDRDCAVRSGPRTM